jgi:hypothetical protein
VGVQEGKVRKVNRLRNEETLAEEKCARIWELAGIVKELHAVPPIRRGNFLRALKSRADRGRIIIRKSRSTAWTRSSFHWKSSEFARRTAHGSRVISGG